MNDLFPNAGSIADQIKCVEREISMRHRVYPRWVANKRMTQDKSTREIATMQAAKETLIKVQDYELHHSKLPWD